MNWKASLFGALLVAVCGLLVGVAVGGKRTTKVFTVTAPPVTTTLAAQATSTAETSSTTTTTTTEGGESTTEAAGPQQFLDDYLASQDTEKLSHDASDVSLNDTPSEQQLQGKTYQHAVVFDIGIYGATGTASYQLPTPGFTHLSSKTVGLETTSSAEAFYNLTVYKNNDSSPSSVILYQASFHGPSEVHKMNFDTRGATDLLFVWTKKSAESAGSQDVFILADPVLTAAS